jgi:hypothetical protein
MRRINTTAQYDFSYTFQFLCYCAAVLTLIQEFSVHTAAFRIRLSCEQAIAQLVPELETVTSGARSICFRRLIGFISTQWNAMNRER